MRAIVILDRIDEIERQLIAEAGPEEIGLPMSLVKFSLRDERPWNRRFHAAIDDFWRLRNAVQHTPETSPEDAPEFQFEATEFSAQLSINKEVEDKSPSQRSGSIEANREECAETQPDQAPTPQIEPVGASKDSIAKTQNEATAKPVQMSVHQRTCVAFEAIVKLVAITGLAASLLNLASGGADATRPSAQRSPGGRHPDVSTLEATPCPRDPIAENNAPQVVAGRVAARYTNYYGLRDEAGLAASKGGSASPFLVTDGGSNMSRNLIPGLLALALAWSGAVYGQGSDAALRDRVGQLVERLAGDKAEDAEKSLVDLGPRAIPFLPDSTKIKDAKVQERLERVRQALLDAQDQANLGPSIVTIQGKGIRLSEALKELQQQSGNPLTDLREQFGAEATNPALELDIQSKPFFEALDIICKAAEISPYFYTGDGTIGLMAGAPDLPAEIGGGGTKLKKEVIYTGPFRVQFRQLAANRDFVNDTSNANAQFEIAWEPRLRPMLLALKLEETKILDDQEIEIVPSVMDEQASVVLRAENPIAELNLNMSAPDRSSQSLKSLKVKADVTVPAGVRAFRFANLMKKAKQAVGDVKMDLVSTEVDEQVWKIRVGLEYPGQGPAFESYQQGLFNNRIWLQKSDGARYEHNGDHGGGFSNYGGGDGKLAFEYLFVDMPGRPSDYTLVYETPSKVQTIPLEFEFQDVPLP